MPPKFGTSGLRGLVTELTDALVGAHVAAFIRACDTGAGLYVGRDFRPSSPAITDTVTRAARAMGLRVTDCGAVPTPALALAAMEAGAAAIMVTGSHIPADRNGLKFYTPEGEITKEDEAAILAELSDAPEGEGPEPLAAPGAGRAYLARYTRAYGPAALEGLRIGLYAHSAVGRDLLSSCLTALGAEVTELARAEHFIPVDTEAVPEDIRASLRAWAAEGGFDAIVSTDGDGDRPLVTDAEGRVIPGDVLGQITARALGAEVVVTPVSSNTGAELCGAFGQVIRTRIGSPYVIAGMQGAAAPVGYEANGGLLLGFDATGPAGPLPKLMTRDALLPIIAPLAAAKAAGQSLAARVAAEPARFTATDRLQEMPTDRSQAFLQGLRTDAAARGALLTELQEEESGMDTTDGLRLSLRSGRILHLRPSGNAPEFRVYAEAETAEAARDLMQRAFALLRQRV
ncbi:phosphomannomutase [Pseudoroseicyclus sp. CXY001]|uniref:phosphomannomutase n=1 Tax=Pseudoroseicyclus sp. CXY001 TaxID=3242492 RepID=UPI0035710DC6